MRYVILLFGVLFFTACSPKYKVVKEYHPPKISQGSEASICIGLCESKRSACKSACEQAFDSCKDKAHKVAMQRYKKKMQNYTKQLENYVDQVDYANFDSSFMYIHYGGYGHPFFYHPRYYGYANSLYWYDPMPYYHYVPPKPKKPSMEHEKLKAEAEICDLDCGCSEKFDACYIGCGGQIESKKLCIENCP